MFRQTQWSWCWRNRPNHIPIIPPCYHHVFPMKSNLFDGFFRPSPNCELNIMKKKTGNSRSRGPWLHPHAAEAKPLNVLLKLLIASQPGFFQPEKNKNNALTMNKEIYASDIYHNIYIYIYVYIYNIYIYIYILYYVYIYIYINANIRNRNTSNIKMASRWKHNDRKPPIQDAQPVVGVADLVLGPFGAPRVQEACWSGMRLWSTLWWTNKKQWKITIFNGKIMENPL